eukprot:TRINITY_DN790_c0_g1_i1.p1 TRINITY_DN790_c0_g1~~TRINITY_DN790_c0_g1_i1.p1  ORF type:complete len:145 (+),score=37.95 TRINITY_DN790_c0_g1_i1:93-527(+)
MQFPAQNPSPEENIMSVVGSPMAKVGIQYVQNNMSKYVPWFSGFWNSLRPYFNVNNVYVMKKLKMLLFPFTHQDWKRTSLPSTDGNTEEYEAPINDIAAPDLYLPTMAFMSFVLLIGFVAGILDELDMKTTPSNISQFYSGIID